MKEKFHEKMWKRLGTVLGAFILLFAAVFAADKWDASKYKSPEWQEYQEFNQLRSQLLDYGFPDYESSKELYEELEISREALELYKTWNFNDTEKFTIDVMRKLADQKSAPSLTGNTVIRFLKRFPGDLLKLPMFYFFAAFLLLWILFEQKNLKALLSVLLEIVLLTGVYFYLYYQGRYMVNRVDVGLWFSGCLSLLWIISSSEIKILQRKRGLFLLIAGVLLSQLLWYKDWRITTSSIPEARVAQRAVLETLGTDKEHICLSKSGVLSEIICYGPFDRMPETLLDNIYWFGGWECRTPGYTQAMAEDGIQNPYKDVIGNDKIYLADDNIELTLKYIQEYYEPNAQAVFVKTVGNVDLYQICK